jgi:hypothetical protein
VRGGPCSRLMDWHVGRAPERGYWQVDRPHLEATPRHSHECAPHHAVYHSWGAPSLAEIGLSCKRRILGSFEPRPPGRRDSQVDPWIFGASQSKSRSFGEQIPVILRVRVCQMFTSVQFNVGSC